MGAKNRNGSLLRVVSIIKSFSLNKTVLGVSEIARKVGMPMSTVHRTLSTLTDSGLLEQDSHTRKYRIGCAFYLLGSLYLSTTDVCKAANSVLEKLNDLTSEAVTLGVLGDGNITVLMREQPRYHFRFDVQVGTSVPAHCGAIGKALLSELTRTEFDRLYPTEKLLQRTGKTISTKTELKRELERIRKTGFSFDEEGTYEGIHAVGSVVRDASGRAVAAMAVSVPIFRIDEGKRERIATLIRLAASLVSYRLGCEKGDPVRDIKEIISWWEQN